jgi:hypothetical protein
VDHVPDRPNESVNRQMKLKFIEQQDRETVIKKFQEDPVWYAQQGPILRFFLIYSYNASVVVGSSVFKGE